MKTPIQNKSSQSSVNATGHRAAGTRPQAARTLEHRYERRKIREQLRRVDWAQNVEDEIFA